jgi:hypothetical protein
MADRYSSVNSMIQNFADLEPTISDSYQNKYSNVQNETLMEQKD